MSNYMTKAAAHARLIKLARAAHYIRRQRALQKYAQAVQMQKQALVDPYATARNTGFGAGIGALGGGLLGAGLGYGFGKKDKKLMSTLLGAGIGTGVGAGVGGLGGYLLSRTPKDLPKPVADIVKDREAALQKALSAWKDNDFQDLAPGMNLGTDNKTVTMNGEVVGYYMGNNKFVPAMKFGPGMSWQHGDNTVLQGGKPIGKRIPGTNIVQLTSAVPEKPSTSTVMYPKEDWY